MLYDFINFRWSKDGSALRTCESDTWFPIYLQHMRNKYKDWKKVPLEKALHCVIYGRREDVTADSLGQGFKVLQGTHRLGRIEISTDEETGETWVKVTNNKYMDFSLWKWADSVLFRDKAEDWHWFDDQASFQMEISDEVFNWFNFHHKWEYFLHFPLYVLIRRIYDVCGEFDFNVKLAAKWGYLQTQDIVSSLTDLNDAGIIDIEKSSNSKYCYMILNVKE